ANWHVFQVLTKRSTLLKRYVSRRYRNTTAPSHIWLGVSFEDSSQRSRLKHLQDTPAAVRFLSIEPLLGPVGEISLDGIHWVIVGGESGPGHRPIEIAWVREIRDQCRAAKVPFFFKQWGGSRPKANGRLLDDRTWDEMPFDPHDRIAAEGAMPELENYAGREQAFVKHTFLETYLDGLLYKVGHVHDEIAYVDGFAGPWQSANEQFTDTSFGLALQKLRQVKSGLAQRGRTISVKAILVEADADAYARLQTVATRFPDLTVRTIHGDFNQSIGAINTELGRAFSFLFVDPKGWSVDMAELGRLISRENCEVVFNFMFDFVNRFAEWGPVSESMDCLFVGVDWRQQIRDGDDRKTAIHECFRESLVNVGRYPYCLSTEVLKSTSD